MLNVKRVFRKWVCKMESIWNDLPEDVKKKLIDKELTIPFFIALTPISMLKDIGVPIETAKKLVETCREIEGLKYYTCEDLAEKWFKIGRITTSSRELDNMLDGGIQTMRIYEFFGPAGVGKTQLCMQLSINTQLPEEKGGLDSKVVYVDTEGGFKAERILQICRFRGLDGEKLLRGIFCNLIV